MFIKCNGGPGGELGCAGENIQLVSPDLIKYPCFWHIGVIISELILIIYQK